MGMLQEIIDLVRTKVLNQWMTSLPVALVLFTATTYIITILSYLWTKYNTQDGQEPPIIPYYFPVLGSTIPFVRDTKGFIHKTL
jgi:hypothetical protein